MFVLMYVIFVLSSSVMLDVDSNQLIDAARNGNEDKIRILLQNPDVKAEINGVGGINGSFALYEALREGHYHVAILLIEADADINISRETDKETALHVAIRNNMTNIVELLLEKKAKPNVKNDRGDTPLHSAARAGNKKAIKLLLNNKVYMEAQNYLGYTALHTALNNKYNAVARMLIEEGADVKTVDFSNNTPLHLAVCNKSTDIVKLLLSKGAPMDIMNKHGSYPLESAMDCGTEDIVYTLLESRSTLHIHPENTPLHYAAEHDNIAILNLSLSKFNGRYFTVETRNYWGETALHLAALHASHDFMVRLLEKGANVNAVASANRTPLFHAIFGDRKSHIELLILWGALLEWKDSSDYTSFNWVATYRKNKACTYTLVEMGADLDSVNPDFLLKKFWPNIPPLDVNTNFDTGVIQAVDIYLKDSRILTKGVADVRKLIWIYDYCETFALYRVLKGFYALKIKRGTSPLESVKLALFDECCIKSTAKTYLQFVPLVVIYDVLFSNHYYGWKFERLSWNVALASHLLEVDFNGAKSLVEEFVSKHV